VLSASAAQRPLWRWRRRLFAFLLRNAGMPGKFFGLPPNRTVELGAQLDI
jgi:KUP system potassium uptake protein